MDGSALGRVYADLGRLPEAVQTERQALATAVQQNNSALVQAVSAHLDQLGSGAGGPDGGGG